MVVILFSELFWVDSSFNIFGATFVILLCYQSILTVQMVLCYHDNDSDRIRCFLAFWDSGFCVRVWLL